MLPISDRLARKALAALAAHFHVSEEELRASGGTGSMLEIRKQAVWAMRQLGLTLNEVGIIFDRDHTSIYQLCNGVDASRNAGDETSASVYRAETDDALAAAVRAVEEARQNLNADAVAPAVASGESEQRDAVPLDEEPDEASTLRAEIEKFEAEAHQVETELDRHGAPEDVSLHARVRALAKRHALEVEKLKEEAKEAIEAARASGFRKLPPERESKTRKMTIAGEHDLYVTVGLYEDGTPGEIFLKMAKQGSMLSGLMDSFAKAASLCLKHGVPLEKMVRKFTNDRFEPSGFAGDGLGFVTSPIDGAFKWIGQTFLPKPEPGEPK